MFVDINWLRSVREHDDIEHIFWCGLLIVSRHCANIVVVLFIFQAT